MPLSGQTQNQSGSPAHHSTYQRSPKLMLCNPPDPHLSVQQALYPVLHQSTPILCRSSPDSYRAWKNTMCVLERTSPSYRSFTVQGYNFSMNTQKRLYEPHRRAESYSSVQRRFQIAKHRLDWPEFGPKWPPCGSLLDSFMTLCYRSIKEILFFAW